MLGFRPGSAVAERRTARLNTQASALSAGGCLSATTEVKDIAALYPSSKPMYLAGKAALLYAAELVAVGPIKGVKPDTALAQQIAFQLVDTTLKLFRAGDLIGGMGASTAQLAVTVLDVTPCSAGLPQSLTNASLGRRVDGRRAGRTAERANDQRRHGGPERRGADPAGESQEDDTGDDHTDQWAKLRAVQRTALHATAQFPPYYQYTFTPSVDSTQTPNVFTYEVCATTSSINVPVSSCSSRTT